MCCAELLVHIAQKSAVTPIFEAPSRRGLPAPQLARNSPRRLAPRSPPGVSPIAPSDRSRMHSRVGAGKQRDGLRYRGRLARNSTDSERSGRRSLADPSQVGRGQAGDGALGRAAGLRRRRRAQAYQPAGAEEPRAQQGESAAERDDVGRESASTYGGSCSAPKRKRLTPNRNVTGKKTTIVVSVA